MGQQNWERNGFKNKEEGMTNAIKCLSENSACGDNKGVLVIVMAGKYLEMKPKTPPKKKEVL